MVKTNKKQLSAIAQKKLEIRDNIFPDLDPSCLWDRLSSDGWLTVPRAMPLLLRIMDMLAPKGMPVSQTYMDLWCRTFEDSFVIVSNPRETAYYAGFTGERAEHTWAGRIKQLEKLGFVKTRPGVSGRHHYVIIYNPYTVIKHHQKAGIVPPEAYNALLERTVQIGSNELSSTDINITLACKD